VRGFSLAIRGTRSFGITYECNIVNDIRCAARKYRGYIRPGLPHISRHANRIRSANSYVRLLRETRDVLARYAAVIGFEHATFVLRNK